jgi:hypothetical protein
MYTPYVRYSGFLTQLDSTAKNNLGALYSPPPIAGVTVGAAGAGYGAQPVYKYVYYNSAINPAPVVAPAPVYWLDETFTSVTGAAEEAYAPITSANGAAAAGYLGPNTVGYSGLTAALLNQSYCWIQVGGFLGGAFEPSTVTSSTFANPIYGLGSGNWTSAVNTTMANSSRAFGVIWSAIAGGVCDVLVGGFPGIFWGS